MSAFLVADDSATKAQYLMNLVDRHLDEIHLIGAMTTEEAKEAIDANPDIIAAFIDYEIPTENGPAVIRYIKEKLPKCLVACVTGSSREEHRQNATGAGADKFVCTAIRSDQLEKTLSDILLEWFCISEDASRE